MPGSGSDHADTAFPMSAVTRSRRRVPALASEKRWHGCCSRVTSQQCGIGGSMKLVKRKTRKAIEKAVRKALKKHGPALVAAVAGGIVSSLAALAGTEA